MAVLHKKEEKLQAVLGRLPKKYTDAEFVAMFIKLFSKDWGKIKAAYIKQSQDKELGTVIHMPKPELYLKQILTTFLTQKPTPAPADLAAVKETASVVEVDPTAAVAVKKPATKTGKTAPAKTTNEEAEPLKKPAAKKKATKLDELAVDPPVKVPTKKAAKEPTAGAVAKTKKAAKA